MNRASSPTGWVRNPVMISPDLDPKQASSYELGWTYNPITGCLNHTPEGLCLGGLFPCYAWKLANGRLKERYLANHNIPDSLRGTDTEVLSALCDPFYPRFWEDRLNDIIRGYHKADFVDGNVPFAAKPRSIFVCDMSDLFGIGIPEEWTRKVLSKINDWDNRFDRFYLLTKQPQNLIKWSPFPENCSVGMTITRSEVWESSLLHLADIKASLKFVSFEPLLTGISGILIPPMIDWLIIGACTGKRNEILELCQKYPELTPMPYGKIWTAQPKIEWVEEIVRAADKAGIPVFLKDNLKPLLDMDLASTCFHYKLFADDLFKLRQEMPVITKER